MSEKFYRLTLDKKHNDEYIYLTKSYLDDLLDKKKECKNKINNIVSFLNSHTGIKLNKIFIINFSFLINYWNLDKNNDNLQDLFFYFQTSDYHENISNNIHNDKLSLLWDDYLKTCVRFKLKLLKLIEPEFNNKNEKKNDEDIKKFCLEFYD